MNPESRLREIEDTLSELATEVERLKQKVVSLEANITERSMRLEET